MPRKKAETAKAAPAEEIKAEVVAEKKVEKAAPKKKAAAKPKKETAAKPAAKAAEKAKAPEATKAAPKAKPAAKKKDAKSVPVQIEFANNKYSPDEIVENCRADYKSSGGKVIRTIEVYVNAAEAKAFYVVNGKPEDKDGNTYSIDL